jgi:hypothetical protein
VDFGWRREKFLKKSKAAKSPRMAQITVGARPAKEDNEQRGCYLQMTLGLMIKGIYENVRRYLGREVTQGQFLMKFASKMIRNCFSDNWTPKNFRLRRGPQAGKSLPKNKVRRE